MGERGNEREAEWKEERKERGRVKEGTEGGRKKGEREIAEGGTKEERKDEER